MILKSPNLATYIVGNVFVSIGSAAMSLITTILTADLISLKVRPFPRDRRRPPLASLTFCLLPRPPSAVARVCAGHAVSRPRPSPPVPEFQPH